MAAAENERDQLLFAQQRQNQLSKAQTVHSCTPKQNKTMKCRLVIQHPHPKAGENASDAPSCDGLAALRSRPSALQTATAEAAPRIR
jgi:hypothetical protein